MDPLRQPSSFSSMVGPRSSSTALPKTTLAPKEGHGETITAERYSQQIDEIHQKLHRISLALVNRTGPIPLQCNARPHVGQLIIQKLNDLSYETLPHPSYSPDLSPTDYHFFKHLDQFLRDKCFKNQKDAKNVFNDFIVSRTSEFYDSV
ncbi:histone-lysine N-methyltransferase SETMAR-like [Euwallacea fornicatus]|uniref:histone-lysine N-methyltransferase SETMAR-like n=1 Tax=Euwallacea fornicatus TaxID=995702 RepID=UPI0033902C75